MRGEPPSSSSYSTGELQALATRQQQQLDTQARLIAAREHRLRQVQEGLQNDAALMSSATNSGGSLAAEAERVRKLRERVEAQEAKLRKLRALRGQTDQQRITNGSLSADLTSIRALFNEKEKELSMAAAQVEELTRQLELFGPQAGTAQAHPGSKAYFVQLHLERLRAELMYRNKLNEQKSTELREKRTRFTDNRTSIGDMEIRINELRERLQRKKQLNAQLASQLSDAAQLKKNNGPSVSNKDPSSSTLTQSGCTNRSIGGIIQQQVAAVEPFNRRHPEELPGSTDDVTDFTATKGDPKYQTLPYNTRFTPASFLNKNNNNNNNNNNNSNNNNSRVVQQPHRGSPSLMMMKGLKVASVQPHPQQPAQQQGSPTPLGVDRPALPPKPQAPITTYKPLLPPRQTLDAGSSNKETYSAGDHQQQSSTVEKGDYLLGKAELPLKPRPLTLKKNVIPPPPPPLPPAVLQSLDASPVDDDDEDVKTEGSPPDREIFSEGPVETPPPPPPPPSSLMEEDQNETNKTSIILPAPPEEMEKEEEATASAPQLIPPEVEGARRLLKKGNLKGSNGADALRKSRRVSFDPLALLLDASLEGELELVKKTALEVTNPSAANDEGITALHNAICAGHLEIVRFLVELGCDVNAQDSDGWTPLHCAASCNNLAMVRFLVEHGACIFAATLSDQETAAEKCEEDEEGFDGCSEYLYSIQEKLGIMNGGRVSAVYDYGAQNADELTFNMGDELIVLRKGDDFEREWWWSRIQDHEGYIPRNLLGLYPRIKRRETEE